MCSGTRPARRGAEPAPAEPPGSESNGKSSMSAPKDKNRDYVNDPRPVRFVLREVGFVPDFERVTSCAAVVFNDARKLVLAYEHGGADFPGGHVTEDETRPEQTI